MCNIKIETVETKRQIVGLMRNSNMKVILMDNIKYIGEEMLGRRILRDNHLTPTYKGLISDLLFNYYGRYDLPEITTDEVDVYIYRLINDGYVFFTKDEDGAVTIYQVDADVVRECGLVEACAKKIRIYIPEPYNLEIGYKTYGRIELYGVHY